jgi:hypothetical protein
MPRRRRRRRAGEPIRQRRSARLRGGVALRPALRAHAQIQRQRFRGQAWYVLHDTAAGKLHRFSPGAYRVVRLLDGERTDDAIWHQVAAEAGADAPTQDEVIRLLAQLRAGDLLQADLPPEIDELGERGRQQKRQELLQSFINPMSIRIPLWNPDAFLARTWPLLQPFAGRPGVALWLLVVLPAVVLAGVHWHELTANLSDQLLATNNLLLLFLFAVPLPLRTHAEGVVWVPENAEVRAGANGFVEHLFAAPEATVDSGEVLLAMSDPALAAQADESRARLRQYAVQYAALMFEDRAQAAAIQEDLQRERVTLARSEEKLDALLVVAGLPGRLKLSRAQDLPGRFVRQGELLGYIVSGPPRLVRVVVGQDDIALVRERRTEVEVKLADRLDRTYAGRLLREVPGGHEQLPSKALSLAGGGPHATDPRDRDGLRTLQRLFQFDLELPPEVGSPEIGTRVFVRFHHHAEPLARQWGRRLRQLFLARFDV